MPKGALPIYASGTKTVSGQSSAAQAHTKSPDEAGNSSGKPRERANHLTFSDHCRDNLQKPVLYLCISCDGLYCASKTSALPDRMAPRWTRPYASPVIILMARATSNMILKINKEHEG